MVWFIVIDRIEGNQNVTQIFLVDKLVQPLVSEHSFNDCKIKLRNCYSTENDLNYPSSVIHLIYKLCTIVLHNLIKKLQSGSGYII